MTYTKPEINTLGDAASVIQSGLKHTTNQIDPADQFRLTFVPAYDLDE